MSVGFGKSSNESQQTSSSDASSFVWDQQIPYLTGLWDNASAAANPGGAGAALGGVNNFMQPLLQNTATNLGGLTDPSGQIAAQAASLQSGLGDLFRNEINPAIKTNAISAGQFGGGRQGVAEGVATGQLANAYTQGYGDIVARANQQALGASALIPSFGQAQQQLALGQYTAPMDILAALSGILGSPTVLQKSQSRGQATGSGSQWGFDFGLPSAQ